MSAKVKKKSGLTKQTDIKKSCNHAECSSWIVHTKHFLLHLGNDGLESLGVVQGEVSEHLAVNLNTSLAELAHKG